MNGFGALAFCLASGAVLIGFVCFDIGETKGMIRAIEAHRPCSKEPKDSTVKIGSNVFGCSFNEWKYIQYYEGKQ